MSHPSDVATLDAIVAAMYDAISGPAGAPRDWQRFRSLFVPGARLMPVVAARAHHAELRVLTPDEFIARVAPIFSTEDFWERETGRQTQRLGHVAHVLSEYDSARTAGGEPFERGANSMQLFHDGARWWIVSVLWNSTRAE